MPRRSETVLFQLWRQGLVSDIAVPAPGVSAGRVARGTSLSWSVPSGEIYYTTDGSDPRRIGGKRSAKARTYTGPLSIAETTTVKARSLVAGEWSPLEEAHYEIE